jgi:hypothetical protein
MNKIGIALHTITAMLITLKLMGAVPWPWLWVLSPSICALGVGVILLIIAGLALLIHKWAMHDPNYRLRHAFKNYERAIKRNWRR